MISHIRNKYLRRTVLVLSSPFSFLLSLHAVSVWAFLQLYEEYTDAFKDAWRGRQP